VSLITARDLELDDSLPEFGVGTGRRVERANDDISTLSRMVVKLIWAGDEADALVDVVAADAELLARAAEVSVRVVPGKRTMPHARLVAKLILEKLLPANRIAVDRRRPEDQQVAPVVSRITRRANDEVTVALGDDPIAWHHVDVGRPDE
jgi:hypothetical protein